MFDAMLDDRGADGTNGDAKSREITGSKEWQRVHRALAKVAKARSALDFREAQCIRAAIAANVHARLGYGSFIEYLERVLGYSPRMAHEKIRVAEALEALPRIAELLRNGALHWSAVRILTRIATEETEAMWIEATTGKSIRDVERLCSGRARGDHPSDDVRLD